MSMPGFISVLVHDFIRPTKKSELDTIHDFGQIICDKFNNDRSNLFSIHHHNSQDNTLWRVVHDINLGKNDKYVMTKCVVAPGKRTVWLILTNTITQNEDQLRLIKLSASPSKITTCGCGSSILNKVSAIKAHRKSRIHLKWIDT